MAVDAYIYFTPDPGSGMPVPKGETQDDYFGPLGAFEIKEFSFDIENPHTISSATSGGGGGKCKFNEFTIKKTTDQASPIFFKNCVAGAHYSKVIIAVRKSGADPKTAGKPFLEYSFGLVFTTKIEWSGPGDEAPEESITFAFGAMQVSYKKQEKSGKLASPVISGWDQIKNKETTLPTS